MYSAHPLNCDSSDLKIYNLSRRPKGNIIMILPIFLKKGDKLHVGHKNRKLLYIKIYLEWNINFFSLPQGVSHFKNGWSIFKLQ